jgi:hypothetical protein
MLAYSFSDDTMCTLCSAFLTYTYIHTQCVLLLFLFLIVTCVLNLLKKDENLFNVKLTFFDSRVHSSPRGSRLEQKFHSTSTIFMTAAAAEFFPHHSSRYKHLCFRCVPYVSSVFPLSTYRAPLRIMTTHMTYGNGKLLACSQSL